MKKSTCCICSQIEGDASNDLVAQLVAVDKYVRRVLLESESFAVIPSIGPLVEGHVLLCPLKHFKSFAQMPATLEDDFVILKRQISEVLTAAFSHRVHCFEHGSAKAADQPMCTVEHAHLHFVPTDTEIWPRIQNQFEWRQVGSSLAELASVVGDSEYLWYESPDGTAFVAKGDEGTFESQYLRKVFAKALGCEEEWNWRETPRVPIMSETYTRVTREVMR